MMTNVLIRILMKTLNIYWILNCTGSLQVLVMVDSQLHRFLGIYLSPITLNLNPIVNSYLLFTQFIYWVNKHPEYLLFTSEWIHQRKIAEELLIPQTLIDLICHSFSYVQDVPHSFERMMDVQRTVFISLK